MTKPRAARWCAPTGSATSTTCSLALWEAGVPVPYPVGTDRQTSVLQQYLGDDDGAAPRLAQARLGPTDAAPTAWEQLVDALRTMTAAGWVHADLSAYNLLWWEEQVWVIDVPQAVDLHASTNGYELLHRDVTNVCALVRRQGRDAGRRPRPGVRRDPLATSPRSPGG